MSEKGLAESGILGTSFNWWIGQIADDSVWRENIICAPFEDKNENKGWDLEIQSKNTWST